VFFVIGEPCTDVMDRTCMQECPADAIYAGHNRAYINPEECIGCGDCALVCPSQAVRPGNRLPDQTWQAQRQLAVDVFAAAGPTLGGSVHPAPIDAHLTEH
jgi:Fe-S-cluster-containing hydrogenase component 2